MLLISCIAILAAPAGASAAASTWTSQFSACGGQDDTERGSGQIDAAGRMYLPCSRSDRGGNVGFDNHIGVFNHVGQKFERIPLNFDRDGKNWRASDVAPSPDGAFLYVMRYGDGLVYRFVRQGNSGYNYIANSQAEWSLDSFPWNGCAKRPQGQFLATDGNGDIYVSHGLWWNNPVPAHASDCDKKQVDTIVKYRPEANKGRYLTRFGQKVEQGGNAWALGSSRGAWGGIAVTANGDRVFVADINNSRIQRFDRPAGTQIENYTPELTLGRNGGSIDANWCYEELVRGLSAPYDVAMSANGEILALNTSCTTGNFWMGVPAGTLEVHRYSQQGPLLGLIRMQSDGQQRVHGISLDRSNNVHLVQGKLTAFAPARWNDAGGDARGGGPLGGTATIDTTAPAITSATAPAETSDRTIAITLAAADNVGVTEMNLTLDGVSGGWTPFSSGFGLTLADRLGAHVITIQVRDAVGNASAATTLTVNRVAAQAVAPVVGGGGAVAVAKPRPKPEPGTKPRPKPKPAPAAGTKHTPAPVITRVNIPVQVVRGRSARVRVSAYGGAHQVRYSTHNGRWGKWRSIKDSKPLVLPRGAGWKPVFTQVRNRSGKRSKVWFHTVFVAKQGTQWVKGTAKADRLRAARSTTHIDVSNFDNEVDTVTCTSRMDTVLAQPEDKVSRSCKRVVRVKMPRW
ncbi:MAG: hypothetical protein ABI200_01750 [Gaiellales bacterium]